MTQTSNSYLTEDRMKPKNLKGKIMRLLIEKDYSLNEKLFCLQQLIHHIKISIIQLQISGPNFSQKQFYWLKFYASSLTFFIKFCFAHQ